MTTTEQTQHEAFAARLRALADVIEQNPRLPLPYEMRMSASAPDEIDQWSLALTGAGHDVTDRTTDHDRSLYCSAAVFTISKVHDEPMRRYRAGQQFLAEHTAEVAALAAAVPVAS